MPEVNQKVHGKILQKLKVLRYEHLESPPNLYYQIIIDFALWLWYTKHNKITVVSMIREVKNDYLSLKAILTSLGVNLTDIDKIKEYAASN